MRLPTPLRVLATPGAGWPALFAAVGRLPIGMYGLALVLFVREGSGSFGLAGAVSGTFAVAGAVGGAVQGRLIDRRGQRRVLLACGAVHGVALLAVVVVFQHGAPAGLVFALAALAGSTLPQLSGSMRALWSGLLADRRQREAAYALEAVMVEACFLLGPALVAAGIVLLSPGAVLVAAALLAAGGTLAYAGTGASRSWRGGEPPGGWAGPLAWPGMRTVALAGFAFGLGVGAVEVAVPAFTLLRGQAGAAGVLLTVFSAGSVAGGFLFALRPWPPSLPLRCTLLQGWLGAGLAACALAGTLVELGILLAAAGLAITPIATTESVLLDRVTPPGTVTEAYSWLVTAVVVGVAGGNAGAGLIVEWGELAAAFLAAGAAVALGAGVTALRRRSLQPRRAAPADTGT